MSPVFAAIGAVSSVAGTVLSYTSQRKAAKANAQQQALATRRQNMQAIREAQIRRAAATNAASQMGAGSGSGIAGGLASLSSQVGSGLGFSTQMSALSTEITKYQNRAQLWGDIAKLGMYAYQEGGGAGAIKGWWLSKQKPTAPPGSYKWGS